MRILGYIVLACLAFSVLQAIAAVIAVTIMLSLIWSAIWHPRETFGLLVFFALFNALEVHPFVTIGVIIGAGAFVWIASAKVARAASADRPACLSIQRRNQAEGHDR
jgi:chromate transport protein ChrA